MQRIFIGLSCLLMAWFVSAQQLTVSNATVTAVQAYESAGDAARVWIYLNGSSRVGPNPVNQSVTCELWTNNKVVHSTALAALMSGKKVRVVYEDRGEGTYWCKVYSFRITAD